MVATTFIKKIDPWWFLIPCTSLFAMCEHYDGISHHLNMISMRHTIRYWNCRQFLVAFATFLQIQAVCVLTTSKIYVLWTYLNFVCISYYSESELNITLYPIGQSGNPPKFWQDIHEGFQCWGKSTFHGMKFNDNFEN